MKRILVLDNYDSFTYNLVHLLGEIGASDLSVARNDKISVAEAGEFEKIILSPGPGIPSEAGLMPEIVKTYASQRSILGVCLGHQCIGEVFGAKLKNLSEVYHGKEIDTIIEDRTEPLFADLPETFPSGRYHSWVVDSEDFPDCLQITARDPNGLIMGLKHLQFDVKGLQFHPESVLTPEGKLILQNWLGR